MPDATIIKKLGKIDRVKFGHCGCENAEIGLYVYLQGPKWGFTDHFSFWDPAQVIKPGPGSTWDETARDAALVSIVRKVASLLADAKVSSVDKLKNTPVEATFDGRQLVSWRILTEVLVEDHVDE